MQLSESLINKFQEAYFLEYGEKVSDEIAEAELLGLAEFVVITQNPITEINEEIDYES